MAVALAAAPFPALHANCALRTARCYRDMLATPTLRDQSAPAQATHSLYEQSKVLRTTARSRSGGEQAAGQVTGRAPRVPPQVCSMHERRVPVDFTSHLCPDTTATRAQRDAQTCVRSCGCRRIARERTALSQRCSSLVITLHSGVCLVCLCCVPPVCCAGARLPDRASLSSVRTRASSRAPARSHG